MPPKLIVPIIRLKEPPDKGSTTIPIQKLIPVSVTKKTLRLDRVVARKEERFFTRSVIKMKLNRFVQDGVYSSKIQEVVKTMNRIAFLAYHFINLHFLLLLQDDTPKFPKLNSHFFYEVCSRVSTLDTHTKKKVKLDPLMDRTSERFHSLLPDEKEILPNRNRLGALISNLVTFLSTATHNHLNLNFEKRLAFWLRIHHEVSDRCKVQYIIDKIFDRRKWPSKFDGDSEARFLISEYRTEFDKPTDRTKISEKLQTFLPFYYKMLKGFAEKEKKLFSLFPLKSSLIPGHVRIDSSCLRDLLALWTGETANKNFLKNRRAGWSEVFRIDSVGTKKQWFSWEMTTNGYDVSIGFRKPVPQFQYSEKQWSGFSDSRKNDILDGLIEKDRGRKASDTSSEKFSLQELKGCRRAGLDPGISALFTVRDSDGQDLQCTKGEYRTLTCQKKVVKAMNQRKDRNPLLKEYNLVFKTPDPLAYQKELKSLLGQLDRLEQEYSQLYYRKQKFFSYTRIKKVFRKLGKRLKSGDGRRTVLGYGDGSVNNPGIRGNYLPVKGFKRYLEKCFQKHIRVVTVDEFRTTKMCSSCGTKTGTVYHPQEVGKDGEMLSYRRGIYGVRRCNNNECRITWNRDKNAARNILYLLNCKMGNKDRPHYLSREKQKQSGKPPVSPDLTGISVFALIPEPIKIYPVLQGGTAHSGISNSSDGASDEADFSSKN